MAATMGILKKVRAAMVDKSLVSKPLSAYLVFSCDAHQSEYTCDYDQRRAFISKFTGSAGSVVITKDKALLWTDGRYHLQASKQLDECWTLMKEGLKDTPTIEDWLLNNLKEGNHVGVDPLLISSSKWQDVACKLKTKNITLTGVSKNLVDIAWESEGKKPIPYSKLTVHDELKYAGVSWEQKIKKLREELQRTGVQSIFIYALDEIAWLFNLRGSDIPYCPVFKAYCVVTLTEIDLFLNVETIDGDFSQHLQSDLPCDDFFVTLHKYEEIDDFLTNFALSYSAPTNTSSAATNASSSARNSTASSTSDPLHKIMMDRNTPAAFYMKFPASSIIINTSPIQVEKSIKNSKEIENIRNACIGKIDITECSAADQLESYRRKMKNFVGLSFNTISGSGSNGAIIHYDPANTKPSAKIDPTKMYLCDSGAQYHDGTTDITRTYHFGEPTEKEKLTYTLVTKGHINLAMAVFPEYTKGHNLDVLARQPLWSYGLDYMHGTGHGIGAFLNVHEGPQCISLHATTDHELVCGMLCSNEPGYYEDGEFGIRFENMIFVVPSNSVKYNFKGKRYCTFETVSYVPIQTSMLKIDIMTADEIAWLNKYNHQCLEKVTPILKEMGFTDGLEWLQKFTQKI